MGGALWEARLAAILSKHHTNLEKSRPATPFPPCILVLVSDVTC